MSTDEHGALASCICTCTRDCSNGSTNTILRTVYSKAIAVYTVICYAVVSPIIILRNGNFLLYIAAYWYIQPIHWV